MTAWEEFITRVMGGLDQNRELINSSVEETHKGFHVVYPKLVWVAKKSDYQKFDGKRRMISAKHAWLHSHTYMFHHVILSPRSHATITFAQSSRETSSMR